MKTEVRLVRYEESELSARPESAPRVLWRLTLYAQPAWMNVSRSELVAIHKAIGTALGEPAVGEVAVCTVKW